MKHEREPQRMLFTIWRIYRGTWTKDGKPMEHAPKHQPKCSHKGPCSFPFKQCDGGVTYSMEVME